MESDFCNNANQYRQYLTHPVDQVPPQEPGVVVLDQPAQSPVADRANDHDNNVR